MELALVERVVKMYEELNRQLGPFTRTDIVVDQVELKKLPLLFSDQSLGLDLTSSKGVVQKLETAKVRGDDLRFILEAIEKEMNLTSANGVVQKLEMAKVWGDDLRSILKEMNLTSAKGVVITEKLETAKVRGDDLHSISEATKKEMSTIFSWTSLLMALHQLEEEKKEMLFAASLEDQGERTPAASEGGAGGGGEEDKEISPAPPEEEEEEREVTLAASQEVAQAMFEVLDLLEQKKQMASASKEGAEALLREVLELLAHKKETVPASKVVAEALSRELLALLEQEKQVPPSTEEMEGMFKQALEVINPLPEKISGLLKSSGRRRVKATTDGEQQLLAFIQSELSAFVTSLTLVSANEHVISHMIKWLRSRQNMITWLNNLKVLARDTKHLVTRYEQDDPLLHAWMRKAVKWFPRSNPRSRYEGILHTAEELYHAAEGPWRYKDDKTKTNGLEAKAKEKVDHFHFVGTDGPRKKLMSWLTAADNSLRVISIVGPPGVGKTALALQVFDQERHHFQCCAEIRIGQQFDKDDFYRKIDHQIEGGIYGRIQAPSIRIGTVNYTPYVDIWKRLHNKRYLIVIDDIWKASDWEEIKFFFPNNQCGSRILITTRIGHVARWCCSAYDGLVHEMKALNEVYSERLLCADEFGSQDGSSQENLKQIILQRSEGIPLFLTGMDDYWFKQQEAKHQPFAIYNTQLPEQLDRKFCSTYDVLPYGLRLFVLYMIMFPPGRIFNKDDLVIKWIHERRASREEAEWFFSQLTDKNVIIKVPANCRDDPDNETCFWKLHHFMWLFIASKSAKMGFIYTTPTLISAAGPAASGGNKNWTPRHLALHQPDPKLPMLLQKMDLFQTRSLSVSGAVDQIPLDKFIGLVVLDLKGWEKLNYEHLRQLCTGKMLLLAYLSLSNTGIKKIPPEIKELLRLRTLDISHTKTSELPPEVFELELLSRLDLRGTQIRKLPKQIVLSHNLQDLLIGGNTTTNANEIATNLPQEISAVKSIEKLETVDLSQYPARFVEALGHLVRLRELAMTWSFHQCTRGSYSDALLLSIQKWRHLESLIIHCGLGCSMDFLGSISKPPKKLRRFKVTGGRFVTVPQWLNGLNHLASLQITLCKLSPDDVKILGGLLRLQCLILGLEFVPKEEVVIEGEGFPALARFSVDCPVPWLTFKTGAMPKLTYLHLKFGSGPANRGSVPSGISNLRSLMEVVLCYNQEWCANSSSVRMTVDAMKREVSKHRKPIDLVINDTVVDVEEVKTDSTAAIQRCDVQASSEGAAAWTATEIRGGGEVEAHEVMKMIERMTTSSQDETGMVINHM